MKSPGPGHWTVYYVLGDGNARETLTTSDPRAALDELDRLREQYAGHRQHAIGVYETDEPERGDREDDLEELIVADPTARATIIKESAVIRELCNELLLCASQGTLDQDEILLKLDGIIEAAKEVKDTVLPNWRITRP